MKLRIFCVVGLLVACSASAQVLWHADFEAPVWWSTSAQYYNQEPVMSAQVIDVGPPQNHALWMSANCTNQVQPWWVAFEFYTSGLSVAYDPAHAYLKFDVLVSKLRPCHARVGYWGPGLDASDMDIDVTPTTTNVFQTFFIPMSPAPTLPISSQAGVSPACHLISAFRFRATQPSYTPLGLLTRTIYSWWITSPISSRRR